VEDDLWLEIISPGQRHGGEGALRDLVLHGHERQQGHTLPDLHQAHDHFHVVAFHEGFKEMAEVVGQFFQVRGVRSVPEADELLARQFPQADGGPGGEGMLRVADKGQRLLAGEFQDQSGPVLRMNGQAQVRFDVIHGFMHARGRVVTDGHPRRRVRGLEPAEAGGQLVEADAEADGQAEFVGGQFAGLLQGRFQPAQGGDQLRAILAANPALPGEQDLWAVAVGQPGFELAFQQRKLPAGGLPGEAKVAGSGGQAAGLGKIAKHPEGLQLHGRFYAKSRQKCQCLWSGAG